MKNILSVGILIVSSIFMGHANTAWGRGGPECTRVMCPRLMIKCEDGFSQVDKSKPKDCCPHYECVADGESPGEKWGGKGVELTVIEGRAVFRFDCGTGEVESDWPKNGKIDVDGTLTQSEGGARPQQGSGPTPKEAHFSGKINGSHMTLKIESEGHSYPYGLTRGKDANLVLCL